MIFRVVVRGRRRSARHIIPPGPIFKDEDSRAEKERIILRFGFDVFLISKG